MLLPAKQQYVRLIAVAALLLGFTGTDSEQQLSVEQPPTSLSQEVCFSPDESCERKLLVFLESARSSIDVAIYVITHEEIARMLIRKARQVPVRIIADFSQAREHNSLIHRLIDAKVPLRYGRQEGIMHHKFAIVDKSRVVTGSFNFTYKAAYNNQENQVYTNSNRTVERFIQRFEKMWRNAQPSRSP